MSLSAIMVLPVDHIADKLDDSLSEEQVRALEELPDSAKVSGLNDPTLSWAVKAGGRDGTDLGRGIAVDSSGNAYVTGVFRQTALFGSTNVTSSGASDIFIAKLSSNGSWQWVIKAGGSSHDWGYGIAVDSSGNAYITGRFGGTATFGNTNLTTNNYAEIFVAKASESGSWQWAVKADGSGSQDAHAIAVDSSGNAYITGGLGYRSSFGSTTLTANASNEIFIAKLNSSGSWQWAAQVGAGGGGGGIAVDSVGNICVTGGFIGTATFGATNLTSWEHSDIFIAKLSSSGSWQWAVQVGARGGGGGIAVDSGGNIYVTGVFNETATFGNTNLTSSGDYDIFISKLSNNGSWQWAVKAGGSSDDDVYGIAVDSGGNAYVTGVFNETATFGNTNLTSSGEFDIFIAKLSSDGSWQWVIKAGGSSDDYSRGIAVDSISNVYFTGYFEKTATFGNTNLTSSGKYDIFISKCKDGDACRDTDGDGWMDNFDLFPYDFTQWADSDGDGYGDQLNGTNGDSCVTIFGNSSIDRYGCADSDGDGFSNPHGNWSVNQGADAFPNESTQWNDTDGDGFGDNATGFQGDDCLSEFGTSWQNDIYGCPDGDGDGWLDDEDNCPSITNQNQTDTDGDEIGDACDPDDDNDGLLDDDDDCPLHDQTTDSNCNGITDLDEDSDGDGVLNEFDECEGHDDKIDSDNNGIPDGCDDKAQPETNTTNSTDMNDFDIINQTSPDQPENNSEQQDSDSTQSSNELEFGKYGLLITVVILVFFTIVKFVKRKETTVQVDDIGDPVEKYAQQLIAQGYEPEYARTYAEHFYAHNK